MSAGNPAVTVRPVATHAEYRACQELQRRAWGITEDGYVVPVATMISVQHAGGLVLGAFVASEDGERLAGFAFAYLGRVGGRLALYSQLAAVDEALRDLGLGSRLKQTQRDWAREQGLDLVAWSFDPLQAGNANFNLRRLGAFCRVYYVNYFGERSDSLNAGLDSDRLLAEWPVAEGRCREKPVGPPRDLIGDDGGPRCLWEPTASTADLLRIEIPGQIGELRQREPALARAWQLAVREAFQQSFAAGYAAVDVQREQLHERERMYYLLRRPRASRSLFADSR